MGKRIAVGILLPAITMLSVTEIFENDDGTYTIETTAGSDQADKVEDLTVVVTADYAKKLGVLTDDGNPIDLTEDHADTVAPGDSNHALEDVREQRMEGLPATLRGDGGTEPTGDSGKPDAFVPTDQTAAGALTPPGGQHPGEPAGLPGENADPLDPYNVNGNTAGSSTAGSELGHQPAGPVGDDASMSNAAPIAGTPLTDAEREANGLPPA